MRDPRLLGWRARTSWRDWEKEIWVSSGDHDSRMYCPALHLGKMIEISCPRVWPYCLHNLPEKSREHTNRTLMWQTTPVGCQFLITCTRTVSRSTPVTRIRKCQQAYVTVYVITDASRTAGVYIPKNYSLRSITNPMCRDQGHELREVSSHGGFELSLLLVLLPGPPPHSFVVLRTFYLNDPLGNNLKMKYPTVAAIRVTDMDLYIIIWAGISTQG